MGDNVGLDGNEVIENEEPDNENQGPVDGMLSESDNKFLSVIIRHLCG